MSNDAVHCGFCRDRAGGCEYCNAQRKHEALVLEELRRIGQALARGDSEARRRELHGPVVLEAQSVMVMLPGSNLPPPAATTDQAELCPPHLWVVKQIGRRHCGRCLLPQRLVWRGSKRVWEFDLTVVADYPVARGKVRTASVTRGSTPQQRAASVPLADPFRPATPRTEESANVPPHSGPRGKVRTASGTRGSTLT